MNGYSKMDNSAGSPALCGQPEFGNPKSNGHDSFPKHAVALGRSYSSLSQRYGAKVQRVLSRALMRKSSPADEYCRVSDTWEYGGIENFEDDGGDTKQQQHHQQQPSTNRPGKKRWKIIRAFRRFLTIGSKKSSQE